MIKFILLLSTCVFVVTACRTKYQKPEKDYISPQKIDVKPCVDDIELPPKTVNDADILRVSEEMFKKADKRLTKKIKFNIYSKPTLSVSESDLNSIDTIRTMRALFDNYQLEASKLIVETDEHRREQNQFLDAVLRTEVMKILMDFLKEKQVKDFAKKLDPSQEKMKQKQLLKSLWFTPYARERGGSKGSSGFKHVFCQEIVNKNGYTELTGLHNWIYFRDQENKSRIAFGRLAKQLDLENNFSIVKFQYLLNDKTKPVTSMFLGTMPEFEMALYSLCVIFDRKECNVLLGRKPVTIKTFAFDRYENKMVASSFPVI